MKTIRELWFETPSRQAITDDAYQYLCKWLEDKQILLTVSHLCHMLTLWDKNCEDALDAINQWLKSELKRNPDFLKEQREARWKSYCPDL